MLVHGDWRIENVNVAAGAVVPSYYWDSSCTEPEIFAVANAMVTHSVDWSRPIGEHFPANAAIRSFLTDYETARGETFAADQHRVIAARMVYHLAYGARCERDPFRRSTTHSKGSWVASVSAPDRRAEALDDDRRTREWYQRHARRRYESTTDSDRSARVQDLRRALW